MSEDTSPSKPRKTPCASCPYRKNVPSGVWDETEYQKLPEYDGETHEQNAVAVFMCHQDDDGSVCSGWLGHRNPDDMLTVRLGLIRGVLDESCVNYTTDVPLFESGAAAAAHGLEQYQAPPAAAAAVIKKISHKRGLSVDQNPHEKP